MHAFVQILNPKVFFLGKFGHKNWSSPNWLKPVTDIHCFILVSNSMLIFTIFFFSYFLGQIWSENLKFSKLTEIWYQGTLLYVYDDFNIYVCKIFVIHSFWGIFGSNLVLDSLIVNSFLYRNIRTVTCEFTKFTSQYGSWVSPICTSLKLENIFNYWNR